MFIVQFLAYQPASRTASKSSELERAIVEPDSGEHRKSQFDFLKLIGKASECDFRRTVLVAIFSSPDNFLLRTAIRNTFGSVLPIKFFLGRCLVTEEGGARSCDARKLAAEFVQHKDIVVYDFVDTYHNLTLKTFSVLNFVEKCASSVKLLVKIDDDTFVNPIRLRDVLLENRMFPSKNSTSFRRIPSIFGHVQRRAKPYRNRSSKYYISEEEYSRKGFPPFAAGPLYFMNRAAADALHRTAKETSRHLKKRPLHLEDVYFTGFMAQIANVSLHHINGLDNAGLSKLPLPRYLVSRHFVRSPAKMLLCWRHILGTKNPSMKELRRDFSQFN
ncbi:beta-1,3-galactosyltransferase 4-like [Galendromus occidentalis]|uniref:Hexosyltransferase n=1 Tax=Galendromus occidentalis TaxID=34638 RepID=A0AAJ6VZ80_9ACAR|nr:beta-1,3-galactosyltransferase 4-like [Galendromus occidentalis]